MLVERLRPVVSRRAGLALGVWGEPGVGKSHAVAAALAAVPCRSATVPAATGPKRWVASLPSAQRLPSWAGRTIEDLADGATPPVADVVAALGSLLAASAPFVLHLDDLALAGAKDRGRANELVRQLGGLAQRTRGVGLIVSSRTEPPEPFIPLRLPPLDEEGSSAALEAAAGAKLPVAALDWIYRKAAGNPLYALEYFRYLARLGHLWSDSQRWHWRSPDDHFMPTSVEALVGQRLANARVDPHNAKLLAALAYLGPGAALELVARASGLAPSDFEAALERLQDDGVLVNAEFAHPLYAEHGLKSLGSSRRSEMAARMVAASADQPLTAARFIDAAGLAADQRLTVLLAAAEASPDRAQAAGLLARAAQLVSGERQVDLASRAATVLQHHDLPKAIAVMALAVATADVGERELVMYAHMLARAGRQDEADLVADRLAESQGRLTPAALKLTSRNVAGDHVAAWAIWERSPELHATRDPELMRAATASALAIGRMSEARELIELGVTHATGPELQCEFLSLRALLAYHSGDVRAADRFIRQALDQLGDLEAPRLRSTALLNLAAFLRMLGDYRGMGESLEECMAIRKRAGDGPAYAFAAAALAELRLEQGRYEEADDLLTEAIGTLELFGASRYLINARSMASALGLAQATPLGHLTALQQAETALQAAREIGNPRVVREILFDAAMANTAVGDPVRAEALARESQSLAAAAGDAPNDAYRSLWALGLAQERLGDQGSALSSLAAAYELATKVEDAIDTHKIGLELARLNDDRGAAQGHRSWFAERGLANGVAIADRQLGLQETLPAVGAARPPRLEVLGTMQFAAAETRVVRGEKRRRLLALLLEARISGRSGVAKLALIDDLYPGQDELKAGSSLKELVYGVRATHGVDLIATTPDGYALGACTSDVEEYLLAPDPNLWRGPYLDGLEVDDSVRDSLYLALARHANDLVSSDPRSASRMARILIEAEPYRVDYLATGLRAYRQAGNHRSLERLYQAARTRLMELGETLPRRWQLFLTEQ